MSFPDCDANTFYDKNVGSCQQCKDICSPPEIDVNLCPTQCKDFLLSTSLEGLGEGTSGTLMITVIVVTLLIGLVSISVLLFFVVTNQRKRSKRDMSREQSVTMMGMMPDVTGISVSSTNYVRSLNLSDVKMQNFEEEMSIYCLREDSPVPNEDNKPQGKLTPDLGEVSFLPQNDRAPFHIVDSESVSLKSSNVEPTFINIDETKSFFQALTDILSNMTFFQRAWMDGSAVKVGLSRKGFNVNKATVIKRLESLEPMYQSDLEKIEIVQV